MSRIVFPLLFVLCTACGPGLEEGPLLPAPTLSNDTAEPGTTDTGDPLDTTDTEDTDTVIHVCPSTLSTGCSDDDFYEVQNYALRAEWFEPPVRFLDMGINTILATRTVDGDDDPLVIVWDFDESGFTRDALDYATLATLPQNAEARRPVAVVAAHEPILNTGYRKLAFFADDSGYEMFGVPDSAPGNATLQPVSGTRLTVAANLHRAVWLQQKSLVSDDRLLRLCLFGDGLYCFDGTGWETVLENPGATIRGLGIALRNDVPVFLLVGDDGLILLGDESGWDDTMSRRTPADLLAVSVHRDGGRFTAVGEQGTFVHASIDGVDFIECAIGTETVLAINYFAQSYAHFNALSATGEVFAASIRPDEDGYACRIAELPGTPLAALPVGDTYFVLTTSHLYGGMIRVIAIE